MDTNSEGFKRFFCLAHYALTKTKENTWDYVGFKQVDGGGGPNGLWKTLGHPYTLNTTKELSLEYNQMLFHLKL